ncbi:hypothetical protein LY78DRAFT_150635 [Colletotrichum sublineola]|nr:hypothetical protein LY78DRAFT_150635 [Colletotrichum sublineola]
MLTSSPGSRARPCLRRRSGRKVAFTSCRRRASGNRTGRAGGGGLTPSRLDLLSVARREMGHPGGLSYCFIFIFEELYFWNKKPQNPRLVSVESQSCWSQHGLKPISQGSISPKPKVAGLLLSESDLPQLDFLGTSIPGLSSAGVIAA